MYGKSQMICKYLILHKIAIQAMEQKKLNIKFTQTIKFGDKQRLVLNKGYFHVLNSIQELAAKNGSLKP